MTSRINTQCYFHGMLHFIVLPMNKLKKFLIHTVLTLGSIRYLCILKHKTPYREIFHVRCITVYIMYIKLLQ